MQGQLFIRVKPASHDGLTQDLMALSGGERSFATVAFITAMWMAGHSPFHCLDEFDVCMDLVNRTVSMDHLDAIISDHPGRQVILLTPQGLTCVFCRRTQAIWRLTVDHLPLSTKTGRI